MIVIRASRSRLWGIWVLAILLVAMNAWLYVASISRVVGAIGMAFFGIGLIGIPIKALGSRLTLVLDREGLITLPSRTPVHRVPWDEITEVQVYTISGNPMIGINVRDPRSLGDRTLVARMLRSSDAAVSGSAINIPQSLLDRSARDLADLIVKYSKSPQEQARLGVWNPELQFQRR